MIKPTFKIKAPVPWMPAGLISWYAPDGSALIMMTAWVALIGGKNPRIRAAWHGRHDVLHGFRATDDFVFNVPYERDLDEIRHVVYQGKFCFSAQELDYACVSGIAAVAPRLLDCAVQIECVAGRLVKTDFDAELCGNVVRIHRGNVMIDAADIPDLCAIQPLTPLGGS